MKRKVLLGVLAGSLSCALFITGTTMLFTAKTYSATNVVTMSEGIEAYMMEKGGIILPDGTHDNDYVEDYLEIEEAGAGQFQGIQFGEISPSQILDKEAIVKREDDNGPDAYVKVVMDFKVGDNWLSELYREDDEAIWDFIVGNGLEFLLPSDPNDLSRYLTGLDPDWTVVNNEDYSFTFYYTDGQNGQLKTLNSVLPDDVTPVPNSVTPPLFKQVSFPFFGAEAEKFAAFAGTTVQMKLTAHLIQTVANPYTKLIDGGDPAPDYAVAFPQSQFPTPAP